jgi:hypothetical protein
LIWRIKNFIFVYNFLLDPIKFKKDDNDDKEATTNSKSASTFSENPMVTFLNKHNKNYSKDEDKTIEKTISEKILNDENEKVLDDTHVKSLQVFNSCLVLMMLDIVYYFIYAFPLCMVIAIYKFENSFYFLVLLIIIAYQCDNGALLTGQRYGKVNFGHPVTPSKTREGIYGAIIWGYISAYLYRYLLHSVSNITLFSAPTFFTYTTCCVFAAIFGDFFESFMKRCANIKDSGKILPGHGGLLDRVDSITLCIPITYYFMQNYMII